MIDLFLFMLIAVLLIASITGYVIMRRRYIRTLATVSQLVMDRGTLMDRLEQLELEASKEVNDGFIKFLSQSREAAFKYIEDVQTSIQNYVDVVDTGTDEEIKLARIELFSHLPESSEDFGKN